MEPMTAPRLNIAPPAAAPPFRTSSGRVVATMSPAVTLDQELLVRSELGAAPPTPPLPPPEPAPTFSPRPRRGDEPVHDDLPVDDTWDDEGSLEPLSDVVGPRAGVAQLSPREARRGALPWAAAAFAVGALGAVATVASVLLVSVLAAGGATAWVLSQPAGRSDATFIVMPENRPGVDAELPASRLP